MRLVSFNVIVVIALLGCLFSVALALASFLPLQPVPILIAAILIASFPFYLANYRGKLVLASNVMVVAVCFILFPAVFFVRGGIESGMLSRRWQTLWTRADFFMPYLYSLKRFGCSQMKEVTE